jgi:hypothetical protein
MTSGPTLSVRQQIIHFSFFIFCTSKIGPAFEIDRD